MVSVAQQKSARLWSEWLRVQVPSETLTRQNKNMSYKKKKLKKSKLSQLRYRVGLAKIALLQFVQKVARKENAMRLPQVRSVMQQLRDRNRIVRSNNLKVSEWVDGYVNDAVLNGRPIEILTQWCISKDLETRYATEGNAFSPTKKERLLFEKEIPNVMRIFTNQGVSLNWCVTFNRSYLDSGRIAPAIERAYVQTIGDLARPLTDDGRLMLADWETDILGRRPEPNEEVLRSIERLIDAPTLQFEVERHSAWARDEAGLKQSNEELKRDVYFQIACEAEEGALLETKPPFGEFILMPLETPERYDFFTLRAPDFKRRIIAALPPYPWRTKETE